MLIRRAARRRRRWPRLLPAAEPAAARLPKLAEVYAPDVLHDEELPLGLDEVVADARQRRVAEVVDSPLSPRAR